MQSVAVSLLCSVISLCSCIWTRRKAYLPSGLIFSFLGTQLHQALWDTGSGCGILVQRRHGEDRITSHKQHPQPAPPALLHQVAMWPLWPGKVPSAARAHMVGARESESTTTGTCLHKSNSPVAWIVRASPALSTLLISSSPSVFQEEMRWLSGLSVSSRVLCVSGTRQPKNARLRAWRPSPACACLFLWLTTSHQELPPKDSVLPVCLCPPWLEAQGHAMVTFAHTLWTDTKHTKRKKEKIFFLPLIY